MNDGEERDRPRTLYTLTLLDILVDAAKARKDESLRHALRDAGGRGFRKADVLEYASAHLEPDALQHLKRVIDSMGRGRREAG